MRLFKRNPFKKYSYSRTLFICFLTALACAAPVYLIFLLITLGGKIPGWLYFILLMILISAFFIVPLTILYPRFLRYERSILGEEAFFKRHPREYRKELRRWRKVSAYINGTINCDTEQLPGLLQLRRDLSDEDAIRLGVVSDKRPPSFSREELEQMEFNSKYYDAIYYKAHPKRLNFELFVLKIKHLIAERILKRDMEVSPYELRLIELKEEFSA